MRWQCRFLDEIFEQTTINHLEFLAVVVLSIIFWSECGDMSPYILAWVETRLQCYVSRKRKNWTHLRLSCSPLWWAQLSGEKNFVVDVLSHNLDLFIRAALHNIIERGENMGLTILYDFKLQALPYSVNSWLLKVWGGMIQKESWDFCACKESYTHGRDGDFPVRLWA